MLSLSLVKSERGSGPKYLFNTHCVFGRAYEIYRTEFTPPFLDRSFASVYLHGMDVQSHYKNHLSKFYTWMFGDFNEAVNRQKSFFEQNKIGPCLQGTALDLGCGSGFQSIALKALGFTVHAIDTSSELLSELKAKEPSIQTYNQDIRDFKFAKLLSPDLIVCMGDTLTHLSDLPEVVQLLDRAYSTLLTGGKLVLTFRDLSVDLKDEQRFIMVRSESDRILTCFLEDQGDKVKVFDLLYERAGSAWNLQKCYYQKLKINPGWVTQKMETLGFKTSSTKLANGMDTIIGQK